MEPGHGRGVNIDLSQLQRWLAGRFDNVERRFADVNHRLVMLEASLNDIATTQATSGEINAVHARLTTIEERLSRLELGAQG